MKDTVKIDFNITEDVYVEVICHECGANLYSNAIVSSDGNNITVSVSPCECMLNRIQELEDELATVKAELKEKED